MSQILFEFHLDKTGKNLFYPISSLSNLMSLTKNYFMIKRKEIRSLEPSELMDLRMAMIAFQDSGGYYELAGYHGLPKHYCPHQDPVLFLAWHRYYIYKFEQGLREINSNVSLPYWDWTNKATFANSIAPAHADQTFIDPTGTKRDNPLYSSDIYDKTRKTNRKPLQLRGSLISARSLVDFALGNKTPTLPAIGRKLLPPHGSVHTGVGGDFSNSDLAAYDPLFWSHHANVDRQWAIWQSHNPDPAGQFLEDELRGFNGVRVRNVVQYQTLLGYEYDNLTYVIEPPHHRVILQINGANMPMQSLIVEVFLQQIDNNKKVSAGIFGIFGMGDMTGHMHHQMLFDQYHDITEALNRLDLHAKNIDPQKDVSFEIRDTHGNLLTNEILKYNNLTIEETTVELR
ncbi:tyrosinase family protein [Chitinophaga sp. GbtcB8]|uniref:tyrosinase family protein n=1 Tax=Chitinophaga sp. GbtcB8 TaxID=2824753 RepID=UPI001C2FAE83|nr:tyrosinase family protein [Chitinophaga sp. GbtcB8]